jgi:peptide/nickel transport system permease protein
VGRFIVRRLVQAAFTVLGVMLLTFVLFRVVPGDVSANYVDARQGNEARLTWLHKHGLDRPVHEQLLYHLANSVTFQGRSYQTEERLPEIIAKRAPISLSLTVPALAIGWVAAMILSCLVAYHHGRWPDRLGVLLCVLGMCIPYLAYMIFGQWLMFQIYPPAAWGLRYQANIFVPVAIAVLAGLGGSVRFYRTVILDQIHSDYVRTARAKGAPLSDILFKHVIKNCMLPILTHLVMAIPFLIMGSLLLESFFGLPGLGDLMISSVTNRDVPIMTGLVFLTSVIYVLGQLATDLLYAVFDPRIRLG